MRGTRRFKVKEKLAPRYVGSFKIIGRKGVVVYQLELPPQLLDVHDIFHTSQAPEIFTSFRRAIVNGRS
jgi:hypothetical protein